jgi:conjugative relaxase-like TrwC/TraI family protein
MISIGNVVSAAEGVRYFDEAVAESQVDYYAGRGEAPGVWLGAGAARLGLAGTVERDNLVRVLEGRDPRSGVELGRHHARQKNVAFDVTFSLPKSVSLLYALGDRDTRQAVLRAMDEGAQAAHEYLERHAAWGRVFNRATGTVERVRAELVTAAFVHRTARPVTRDDGRTTVDPQLHTHLLVASFVHRANGTWGQLYSEPLYAHAAAASAVGQAAARSALIRDLGVRVRTNPNATFELEGISKTQLAEFSQRHAQVVAAAARANASSLYGMKVAVLDSRQSKREVDPGMNLFGHWAERAAAVGLTGVTSLLGKESIREGRVFDISSAAAIIGREKGITATASVFTRREVIRKLATHAPLGMSLDGLEEAADAILSSDAVVPLVPPAEPGTSPSEAMRGWVERGMEVHYSTPEVVTLERRMLESAQARVGEGTAVIAHGAVEAAIAGSPTPLTEGQRAMVEAACTSPDGVVVVEGAAGVGKTTAARIVREAFVADGRPVLGCAPSGRAVRGLEADSGIPSSTVASILTRLRHGYDPMPPGSLLLVDECSMLGPDLAELVLLAHRDRVKLLLVGDSQQLQPIDGGALFRALGDAVGRTEVTEVLRQKEPWEREALTAFRRGDVAPLVGRYLEEGRVHESPTQSDRIAAMSAEWVAATTAGYDCIGIARERITVAELNAATRQGAVQAGLVAPWGEYRRCVEDVGRQRIDLGELEFAPGRPHPRRRSQRPQSRPRQGLARDRRRGLGQRRPGGRADGRARAPPDHPRRVRRRRPRLRDDRPPRPGDHRRHLPGPRLGGRRSAVAVRRPDPAPDALPVLRRGGRPRHRRRAPRPPTRSDNQRAAHRGHVAGLAQGIDARLPRGVPAAAPV